MGKTGGVGPTGAEFRVMEREQSTKVVGKALDSLPHQFRRLIRNVVVLVQGQPSNQLRSASNLIDFFQSFSSLYSRVKVPRNKDLLYIACKPKLDFLISLILFESAQLGCEAKGSAQRSASALLSPSR
jgi:hypothetical protein